MRNQATSTPTTQTPQTREGSQNIFENLTQGPSTIKEKIETLKALDNINKKMQEMSNTITQIQETHFPSKHLLLDIQRNNKPQQDNHDELIKKMNDEIEAKKILSQSIDAIECDIQTTIDYTLKIQLHIENPNPDQGARGHIQNNIKNDTAIQNIEKKLQDIKELEKYYNNKR